MTALQLIVLAIVQGLTEFLPISSSAHLILVGDLLGWPDEGLAFDVATHFGTLFAVLFYFRVELAEMLRAMRSPDDPSAAQHRQLAKWLMLASLPALLIGLVFAGWIAGHLRDVRVIAVTTIAFGALLWWADVRGRRDRDLATMGTGRAMAVGVAQALALIPGVSRSGITITAGRMIGLDAESAARFSFLLSIPVIAAAGIYGLMRVATGQAVVDWSGFVIGVTVSALAGWACIAAFLALVRRVGLLPFIIYRLLLGAVLLLWFW